MTQLQSNKTKHFYIEYIDLGWLENVEKQYKKEIKSIAESHFNFQNFPTPRSGGNTTVRAFSLLTQSFTIKAYILPSQ